MLLEAYLGTSTGESVHCGVEFNKRLRGYIKEFAFVFNSWKVRKRNPFTGTAQAVMNIAA